MLGHSLNIMLACLLALVGTPSAYSQNSELASVDATLTRFHGAAAASEWDSYFRLLSDDAIFLGTDATERWTKTEFEQYARKTNGWTYTTTERHINFTPDGNSAWFDELLWNNSYGLCRGTGVVINTDKGWLISQYHLTVPIPNEVFDQVLPIIKN